MLRFELLRKWDWVFVASAIVVLAFVLGGGLMLLYVNYTGSDLTEQQFKAARH